MIKKKYFDFNNIILIIYVIIINRNIKINYIINYVKDVIDYFFIYVILCLK